MASQTVPLSDLHDEPPQTVKLSELSDAPPTERKPQSSSGALVLAGAAKAAPTLTNAATELATSPSVPRAVASVGRAIGGAAPIVSNPASPTAYLAAPGGAWAGGKAGYFGGRMIQNAAAPIASALEKAAPYVQAVSTLSGAQGALDLAQMAEPERTDIGVLGVGTNHEPTASQRQKAADNQKRAELMALAQGRKLSLPEAVAQVLPIEFVQKLISILKK